MALKAGRVGVAPDQVDEFGKIISDATQGYTKQEADAKFETKSDAEDLQPKRLAVPISMLQGSLLIPKTTVEDVIQTMDEGMTNKDLSAASDISKSEALAASSAYISSLNMYKRGYMIQFDFGTGSTASGYSLIPNGAWTKIGDLKNNYIPKKKVTGVLTKSNTTPIGIYEVRTDGGIYCYQSSGTDQQVISDTVTYII